MNKLFSRTVLCFLSLTTLLVFSTLTASAQTAEGGITITPLGTYDTGIFDDSGAEIVAYDDESAQLFVTNAADGTIDILDISEQTCFLHAFCRSDMKTKLKVVRV